MKKIISIIILVVFCLFLTACDTKLNETKHIEGDNINLTVLGSEEIYLNNGIDTFKFIKVKVKIENLNDNTYSWINGNFSVDNNIAVSLTEKDQLERNIAPKETKEGYLYFMLYDNSPDEHKLMYLDYEGTKIHRYTFLTK